MIFSILSFIFLFISICTKDRDKSLKIQSINCIFESLYALSISAYTASLLGFVNFIRSVLFICKNKFEKFGYFILLFVFETVIILNCIITWNGIISLFPTFGSFIRTFCLWQSNMKYVRLSAIVSSISFATYYIYHNGWFMAMGYILLFMISFYSVCKNDLIKNKIKTD